MRAIFIAAVITLAPVIAAAGEPCGVFGSVDCCTLGGTFEGDALMGGYSICQAAPESDIAPDNLIIHSAACYAQGARAASNTILAGGIDEKSITVVTPADTAADTVIATRNGVALAALTEGVDWACAALTATQCATNLAAAIEAQTGSGVAAGGVAAVAHMQPNDCATWGLSYALSDGVAMTYSGGTDGNVVVGAGQLIAPGGSAAAPGLALGDGGQGFFIYGSGVLGLVPNGTVRWNVGDAYFTGVGSESGILYYEGSALSPFVGVNGDSDVGLCHAGADQMGFCMGGVLGFNCVESASVPTCTAYGPLVGNETTLNLGAADNLYLNGTSTKHTQTAGVIDVDMAVADGTAGGQVAIDVSSTTPAEGLSAAEAQYGVSVSITGDAQDDATSVHIVNQVAYTPNGGGGTSYGYYAADTDFDYGFYTTANSEFAAVTINGAITVPSYDVDYVISAGSAGLGPTAPTWTSNGSCHGLTFDADAELAHLTFEIPDCYAGGAGDDLVLRIYWCAEDGQNPALNDVVKWDIDYRALIWGTDDVDSEAAIAGSVSYTEASDPGDEGDTHISSITLDADAATQALDVGDTLAIHFDRDWGVGSNYAHDAIIQWWEIQVPQTSLKCDHF